MAKWKAPSGKSHITLRGKTYFARLTVPQDVREDFGKSELWQSLKTSDVREAEFRAAQIVNTWKGQIAGYRNQDETVRRANEWKRILDEERRQDSTKLDQFRRGAGDIPLTSAFIDELELGRQQLVYSDEVERILHEHGPEAASKFDDIVNGKLMPTPTHFEPYKTSLKVIPRTLKQRDTHLKTLAQRFPSLPVKRSDVAKWILDMEANGKAEMTIKGLIGTCRGYFDYLQRVGHIDPDLANPFNDHKYTRRNKGDRSTKRQAFEPDEVVRLIEAARNKPNDTNLLNAILIGAYTGMRREEIARLRVENVRERNGIKYFEIFEAKTGAGLRDVPVHSELLSVVEQLIDASSDGYLLPGEPITTNGERGDAIGKRFKTLKENLGFDRRYVFHSIRKTVSTMFERSGVNHNQAAEIVGHEKTGMTYGLYSAGMDLKSKREIVEKLLFN